AGSRRQRIQTSARRLNHRGGASYLGGRTGMSTSEPVDPLQLPLTRRDALVGGAMLIGSLASPPLFADDSSTPPEQSGPAIDPLIERPGELGKARSRLDGPAKVTGEARFAAELRFENMTYGALVFSTIPRGTIA